MRMYLVARILNFDDSDLVAMVELFKYSIIGLLQSGASIIITFLFGYYARTTEYFDQDSLCGLWIVWIHSEKFVCL